MQNECILCGAPHGYPYCTERCRIADLGDDGRPARARRPQADVFVGRALRGLDTSAIGYDHRDAERQATAHALLALVAEQRTATAQLASIGHSLDRIAHALEVRAVADIPAPAPAPRRRWFSRRPYAV